MKTRLWTGRTTVPFKTILFPGGEVHVTIDPMDIISKHVLIDARVRSPLDFMEVLALKNALSFFPGMKTHLNMPYFPGARSDREEIGHEMGVEIYTSIINDMEFESITILDPHSPVLPALLGKPHIRSPRFYFDQFVDTLPHNRDEIFLVCPDAGAEKRTYQLAKNGGFAGVKHARKHRDPETGKLSGFEVEQLQDYPHIVVDDICDGGGTFIGLAREIKDQTDQPIYLWVTHGIFSKGVGALLDMGYKAIGTTDSFYEAETTHPNVHVFPVNHMREE